MEKYVFFRLYFVILQLVKLIVNLYEKIYTFFDDDLCRLYIGTGSY
jgi:hypothetical protein